MQSGGVTCFRMSSLACFLQWALRQKKIRPGRSVLSPGNPYDMQFDAGVHLLNLRTRVVEIHGIANEFLGIPIRMISHPLYVVCV